MILEGGSQNASRIPGQYAYPVQRYQPGPIEPISSIRSNALSGRRAIHSREESGDDVGALLERSRQTHPRKELFRPDMYEARRPAENSRESAAALARDLEKTREPSDSYANSVFRARSDVTRGLFVNLLG